jgi:hypothetical protein
MTITDEISIIANKLANAGKKPTVALVKAKLSSSAPLPLIISTLKNWTHDVAFIEQAIKTEKSTSSKIASPTTSELDHAIKQALQPIEVELAEIKALLIELKNQSN